MLRQQGGDECGVGGVALGEFAVLGGLAAVLFNQTLVEVCRVGEVTVVRQAERAVRGAPVVEYRAWPIAWSPGMELRVASSKTWETSPISLYTWMRLPLLVAIPADSWPRCWSAYRP